MFKAVTRASHKFSLQCCGNLSCNCEARCLTMQWGHPEAHWDEKGLYHYQHGVKCSQSPWKGLLVAAHCHLVGKTLPLKLQLSTAKFKGDKCAPFKPDWYPQLGTDESPESRKIQNIHKSSWEQQDTQALHPIGQHPPSTKPTGFLNTRFVV